MEIFLIITLYFWLIVFYYLVVMDKMKKIFLYCYLVFQFILLIFWVGATTLFYVFMLFFIYSVENMNSLLSFFLNSSFILATLIYGSIIFCTIYSIRVLVKLIKGQTVPKNKLNILYICTVMEIIILICACNFNSL